MTRRERVRQRQAALLAELVDKPELVTEIRQTLAVAGYGHRPHEHQFSAVVDLLGGMDRVIEIARQRLYSR